ncbi:MAG TPA: pseudouridine synthase [Nitrospiraceae bacterium]|nr:pseudouridine synthase [Nitrospiraceae bacterium]
MPPAHAIRINRFFTQQGMCSRREADRLIEEGRVTINGCRADLGDRVYPDDVITKDGIVVPWGNRPIYIKFHKPIGVTTTSEPHVRDNIIAYIGHPERIFPIGRLDKDSSGLILLTNDGAIVNRILRAEHHHEKEYLVQVDRSFDQTFLDGMAGGVVILNRVTRPCVIWRVGPRKFRIILTEGRNRQIRRMCHALGYRVVALHRTRIMNVTIDSLPVGRWENLTGPEREELMRVLAERQEKEP